MILKTEGMLYRVHLISCVNFGKVSEHMRYLPEGELCVVVRG